MINANEAVARGAEWLDKVNPGWERKIDLSNLKLADGCRCIIGQVVSASYLGELDEENNITGMFRYAVSPYIALFASFKPDRPAVPDEFDMFTIEHGFFTAYDSSYDFHDLDEAWIALIKQRFELGILSDEVE